VPYLHLIFTPDSVQGADTLFPPARGQGALVPWGHYHILRLILHPNFKNVQTVNNGFSGNSSLFSRFLDMAAPSALVKSSKLCYTFRINRQAEAQARLCPPERQE
jgi:hypothetical protein